MEERDVETYWDGRWMTRRVDSKEPFSSGGSRLRQISIGAEVARWAGARHLIRRPDGSIEEIDVYNTGPYPSRSPARTIRPEQGRRDADGPEPLEPTPH